MPPFEASKKTVAILQVGEDANAELLRSSLQDAGVDLQHLRTVKGPSGSAVILLQPSGALTPRLLFHFVWWLVLLQEPAFDVSRRTGVKVLS